MPEEETLLRLSHAIQEHLGVEDTDLTLSRFVLGLYRQTGADNSLATYKTVVGANGGDDFPEAFVSSTYAILHNPVKQEVKIESGTAFPGLSIPNNRVEWDRTDDTKPEFKQEIKPHETTKSIKRENPHAEEGLLPNRIALVEGNIYKGYVGNLTAYGAFIRLHHARSFQSGLCHVSQLLYDGARVLNPLDVLKLDQEVFVKVLKVENGSGDAKKGPRGRERITLSMRGIDQTTGTDNSSEIEEEREKRGRELRNASREQEAVSRGTKRRLTSPERWEIRQLIASGAASAADYPELLGQEDPNDAFKEEPENDIVVDIELNTDEPRFLKGQTKSLDHSEAVKLVKNPEGSLSRSAMTGSKLAQEFKEERSRELKDREKAEKQASQGPQRLDPIARNQEDAASRTQTAILEWKRTQMGQNITYGKRTNLPMAEQRQLLPVYSMRADIVQAVRDHQFLVIVGETGSGKTTQIVQYLYEDGLHVTSGGEKTIGCTQPRRVAAKSVAKRVSEEVGCETGGLVGYNVRFDDNTSPQTRIKYMTDGMLQREALSDPSMSKYSIIMLDEAHERTVATDVLFALLKQAASLNLELKVIVTLATLDSDKFSRYFHNCPIMNIPGRTYPVEILYTREPEMDYLLAALDLVVQIHVLEPRGDILVFLTGQDEIDTSCELLYQRIKALGDSVPELLILPVYLALPLEVQSRIFEPTPEGSRKVVLATNIAETSITIDGIYYVIDPGFVKLSLYDARLGMDTLAVSPILQAQANQRSGRAGRTGPGKCYRLYTETAFTLEMLPNTVPEIQRQNLAHTLLMLKAMGINDLLGFEFMDPPPAQAMLNALQELFTLAALDEDGLLTPLGRKMADFPMEPTLAKTLIASADFGCLAEILSIMAMLSVPLVFYRPKEKQALADQRKARFHHLHGDHLTLLNVYNGWINSHRSRAWCSENFVQERTMRRVAEVRQQLVSIMQKHHHLVVLCGPRLVDVRRAICAGFFKNAARRDPQEGYKTLVDDVPVAVHPSLALFGKSPEYCVYHSLVLTSREYMHCVTTVDPRWLAELAPGFFKVGDGRARGGKIVPLHDRFAEKDSWRLSAQAGVKRRAMEAAENAR